MLKLSGAGYVPRFAKVTVPPCDRCIIQHRELVRGDVNNSMKIDVSDINEINYKVGCFFGAPGYEASYDVNGDSAIDIIDVSFVNFYQGFHIEGYDDTLEWLIEHR